MNTTNQKVENEKWTVENFVDVINEILLQTRGESYEGTFNEVQDQLVQFLKGEIDGDQFSFEFAMLISKRNQLEGKVEEVGD